MKIFTKLLFLFTLFAAGSQSANAGPKGKLTCEVTTKTENLEITDYFRDDVLISRTFLVGNIADGSQAPLSQLFFDPSSSKDGNPEIVLRISLVDNDKEWKFEESRRPVAIRLRDLDGDETIDYVKIEEEVFERSPKKFFLPHGLKYKRKIGLSGEILNFGESLVIPEFMIEEEFTTVLEVLARKSSIHSPNEVGLSIIPLFNPNERNPRISVEAQDRNFFEILDLICIKAGPEFYWSAENEIAVYANHYHIPVGPVDPFSTPMPNKSE